MNSIKNLVMGLLIFLLVIGAGYAGFRIAFRGLIFPKISVSGINVGGMDKVSAMKVVDQYFSNYPSSIVLRLGGAENEEINKIEVERDYRWAVEQAYNVGRSGNLLTQISEQIKTLYTTRNISMPISYDNEELLGFVDQFSLDNNKKPIWPKLTIEKDKINLISGSDGLEINKELLVEMIVSSWSVPDKQIIDVPFQTVFATENTEMVNRAIASIEKWGERTPIIKQNDFEYRLSKEEMVSLYGLTSSVIENEQFETLLKKIQPEVETEPRDAVFQFEGDKVIEFKPEVVGVIIDVPAFNEKLASVMITADSEYVEIPVILSNPEIRAEDINNLGIKELIGEGKSSFSHSIPGRVFNVNLASSRINSTVVPPGEEFSFNKAVGDISRATGYQSAYIISGGKTILGDGGGVCQVSTTVFRAALDAGFPITQRKAHAYRVGYYEQDSKPGIDATVYNPTVDFRFLNDTENHILVQTEVDTKNLKMSVKIYGTSDGRVASISVPKISSQTAPPATMYVDDPTLPVGQTRQIDWAAWGAKVSFNYKVVKADSTVIEKTFYSNYQPWQAVYLKGTKI